MTIARKAVVLGALLPALALSLFALPALAHSPDDTVVIVNEGGVMNVVGASANSGGNFAGAADGGDGEEGGNGGDIEQGGDYDGEEYDVEDSDTGNGGAGGDGGNGGTGGSVSTGEAVATAGSFTVLNSNSVGIRRGCGCEEEDNGDIDVVLVNGGFVFNLVGAAANSGENAAAGADGGDGEEGGNGGDIEQDGDGDYDVDNSDTGNGGAGGDGGNGGTGGSVSTGRADSLAFSETYANLNDVLIRR